MRYLLYLLFTTGCVLSSFAQQQEINWLSFEEAMQKHAQQPRPIILDAYTDWCGWCKRLDATTFRDPNIVDYINRNYYAIKFEADTKDTITFKGKEYINSQPLVPKLPNKRAPMHRLAATLGVSSFPTIVYFDKELNANPVPGYQNAKDIQSILVFFGEEVNKVAPYDQFLDMYNKTFYPQEANYTPKAKLKTYAIEDALELQKKAPKKILIDFRANYKLTSRMMPTTFEDSVIANYLNENFYVVEMDVFSKDTINAFGGKFYVDSLSKPFNGLAVAMLEAKMNDLPAILILDENQKMVDRIRYYLTPQSFEPIMKFYGENKYTTQSWPEFRKQFEGEL